MDRGQEREVKHAFEEWRVGSEPGEGGRRKAKRGETGGHSREKDARGIAMREVDEEGHQEAGGAVG